MIKGHHKMAFDPLADDKLDIERLKAKEKDINSKIDYLIHQTFVQNESGAKLLEEWKQSVLMLSGDSSGNDLYSLGKVEGFNSHIRYLLRVIKKVGEK